MKPDFILHPFLLAFPAKDQAEAVEALRLRRRSPCSQSHTGTLGAILEGAAAKDAIFPITIEAQGVFVGRSLVKLLVVPILTPLPHVAVHVEQTPGIGFFLAHGMRLFHGILAEPGKLTEFRIFVPEVEFGRGATSARIFPFRLGGQGIIEFGFLFQFGNELLAIFPRDILDREIISLDAAGILAHDGLPLFLGHFMSGHPESLADFLLLLRMFVFHALGFGTAHVEFSRRDPEELHAERRVDFVFDLWRLRNGIMGDL